MNEAKVEPLHIEITSYEGASKWIRGIVSHTEEEIHKAWEDGKNITIIDLDGCKTDVDMTETFMIRYQDDRTFKRRSQEARSRAKSKA